MLQVRQGSSAGKAKSQLMSKVKAEEQVSSRRGGGGGTVDVQHKKGFIGVETFSCSPARGLVTALKCSTY